MRKIIPIAAPEQRGGCDPSAGGPAEVVHVLQHTSAEYLGLIEDHLEGRGMRFRYARPFAGKAAFPAPDALGEGLVVLGGGPWGSAGGRDIPTLAEEVALAKACLERRLPIVGIGLGAQILALACGGRSERTPQIRFSVGKASRTREGALAGYLPQEYPLAVYMRDRAVPPSHAEILSVDDEGWPALWQVGGNALGFAGHPGLKVAMVEDLIMEFEEVPPAPEIERGLAALRHEQRALEDALVPIMTGLVRLCGWMKLPT